MIEELVAVPCSDVVAELGEGVVWDEARSELLWVDILAGRLHRGRPGPGGLEHLGSIDIGFPLGAVAPARDGGWIVAAGPGFAAVAPGGTLRWISVPAGEEPQLRMNDGACDPGGRFWAGTLAYDETPGAGTLYRLDPDYTTTPMVTGTTISNGLGWSVDATTLWFADSGAGTVDAFAFDGRTATVSARRTVIAIDPRDGSPDGLSVDREDHVWVAIWDGGEVRRYSPSGDLVARVTLPVSRPTSCCFGGVDLGTLFISTARIGLGAEQLADEAQAGRLFATDAGVRGVAQAAFAGPTLPARRLDIAKAAKAP
ncbi:MAG: SMP-30/gluconolactonase/LRE family protein [Solirubrobacteraceae bacterium]|jgi:sugar lactone lactonase YvrE